jgi:hypothetical protein
MEGAMPKNIASTRPRRVEASSKLRRVLGAEARRLGTTPGQLAAALWQECLWFELLAAKACLRDARVGDSGLA